MTLTAIESRLEQITIGRTTTIDDHAVTRWSAQTWEVDTWGRKTMDFEAAVNAIKN